MTKTPARRDLRTVIFSPMRIEPSALYVILPPGGDPFGLLRLGIFVFGSALSPFTHPDDCASSKRARLLPRLQMVKEEAFGADFQQDRERDLPASLQLADTVRRKCRRAGASAAAGRERGHFSHSARTTLVRSRRSWLYRHREGAWRPDPRLDQSPGWIASPRAWSLGRMINTA